MPEPLHARLADVLLDHQPNQSHDGMRHTCSCGEKWSVNHQAEALLPLRAEARADGAAAERAIWESILTPQASRRWLSPDALVTAIRLRNEMDKP
jgi:hypothetical protein